VSFQLSSEQSVSDVWIAQLDRKRVPHSTSKVQHVCYTCVKVMHLASILRTVLLKWMRYWRWLAGKILSLSMFQLMPTNRSKVLCPSYPSSESELRGRIRFDRI